MRVTLSGVSRLPVLTRIPGLLPLVLSAALAVAGCTPKPVSAPEASATPAVVRLLATDLTEPLLLDLAGAYTETNRDIALIPEQVPAGALAADLDSGQGDLGLALAPATARFATPLGYVRLVVVVPLANQVKQLDLAQVQALFSGQVTDWAQLGGAPGPVQPVVRPAAGDAAQLFSAQALSGAAPSPGALLAPTWAAMLALVSQTPGAIGYLPSFALDASVQAVRLPADLRALIVAVATTEPAGPARDFLAWAQSGAGQAVVAQRHEALK